MSAHYFRQEDFNGVPTSGWFWTDDECCPPVGPFKALHEAMADYQKVLVSKRAERAGSPNAGDSHRE